jgi:hypothetical protein
MELPDDVLSIVRDFSRPVTRPDWRDLHRLGEVQLLWRIASCYNTKRIPVIERFILSYHEHIRFQPNFTYLFRAGFIVNIIQN